MIQFSHAALLLVLCLSIQACNSASASNISDENPIYDGTLASCRNYIADQRPSLTLPSVPTAQFDEQTCKTLIDIVYGSDFGEVSQSRLSFDICHSASDFEALCKFEIGDNISAEFSECVASREIFQTNRNALLRQRANDETNSRTKATLNKFLQSQAQASFPSHCEFP